MIATPNYPTDIWDASSLTRTANRQVNRDPDFEDWDQIVAEMIAVQTDLTNALNGKNVGNVANADVIGGIPVMHKVTIADATGDTDVILTHKTHIVDVVVIKTTGAGGAGDTLTVKNGSTAITNAIVTNIADKTIARAGTIDDASNEIAAGGTLRLSANKATNAACVAYVLGLRVA